MAKGKTVDEQVEDLAPVETFPHPSPLPKGEGEEVTVVAVERLFRVVEHRYVEPGEMVALDGPTAALLMAQGCVVAVDANGA